MKHTNEKLWNKDYILIMLSSTGISFCNYFFFSTLPIYAQNITGSVASAGLMTGVYTFAALAIRPFSGIFADKFGRTKLLILGAILCVIACFLYRYAAILLVLIVVRSLHGIGFGMHSTAGGAVAADVIPKSRMAEGIGYFGLYGTIASAVGPGIALAMIRNNTQAEFNRLFFVSSAICIVSLIINTMISYERKCGVGPVITDNKTESCEIHQKEALPKTLMGFEYAVFPLAAVLIILYFAQSSINSFLSLYALQQNFGNIGLYFTFNAIGLFLSRVFLGKLADRKDSNILVIPGIIITAICLALIPYTSSALQLFILGFPMGIAIGAIGPTINTMMFQRCSAERRGTASAAYFSSIDLGFGIGGIALGFVAAAYNYHVVYWLSAVFALLSLACYIWLECIKMPMEKNNREQQRIG
ncbi:MAG: MFS transporter [Anaerofustis sp.]